MMSKEELARLRREVDDRNSHLARLEEYVLPMSDREFRKYAAMWFADLYQMVARHEATLEEKSNDANTASCTVTSAMPEDEVPLV